MRRAGGLSQRGDWSRTSLASCPGRGTRGSLGGAGVGMVPWQAVHTRLFQPLQLPLPPPGPPLGPRISPSPSPVLSPMSRVLFCFFFFIKHRSHQGPSPEKHHPQHPRLQPALQGSRPVAHGVGALSSLSPA